MYNNVSHKNTANLVRGNEHWLSIQSYHKTFIANSIVEATSCTQLLMAVMQVTLLAVTLVHSTDS